MARRASRLRRRQRWQTTTGAHRPPIPEEKRWPLSDTLSFSVLQRATSGLLVSTSMAILANRPPPAFHRARISVWVRREATTHPNF